MATRGGGVGRSQAPDPPLRYLNQGPSQAGLTVHWWSDGTSGRGWEGQLGGSGGGWGESGAEAHLGISLSGGVRQARWKARGQPSQQSSSPPSRQAAHSSSFF